MNSIVRTIANDHSTAMYRHCPTETLEARERARPAASDRGSGCPTARDGRCRRREGAESLCRLADELAIHRDLESRSSNGDFLFSLLASVPDDTVVAWLFWCKSYRCMFAIGFSVAYGVSLTGFTAPVHDSFNRIRFILIKDAFLTIFVAPAADLIFRVMLMPSETSLLSSRLIAALED